MKYLYRITEFGETIYFSFLDIWNWLFTPIVLYENTGGYGYFDEQGTIVRGDFENIVQDFNNLFGMLFDRQIQEISFTPVEFVLYGLTTLIIWKLIAAILDALPWL